MNKITETVYQGDLKDALEACKTKTVGAIVYLGQVMPKKLSYCELPIVHIPLNDGYNSEEKVEIVLMNIAFLSQDLRILIACRAGLSRSVALVIGYLMSLKRMDFNRAYLFAKKNIPEAIPEPNLLKVVRETALLVRKELEKDI